MTYQQERSFAVKDRFGGSKGMKLRKLKQLKNENRQLKKLVSI